MLTRFDGQQQPTQGKGEKYLIETKENWKYRATSNLHPGGDGRGFSSELGA